ncbi:hypothetical protein NGH30_09995 [Macrococcus caseolyticus]|uniref:hypothetical protein n=1 Tax=Macrococcoides caseolyticum TaxID=69966 RepID=UPI002DBDC36D|nr:hypothetical protein [Macrococcus caseolyticus]MEB8172143.1 hypothetical protein [Macrococcus caseolyticus]
MDEQHTVLDFKKEYIDVENKTLGDELKKVLDEVSVDKNAHNKRIEYIDQLLKACAGLNPSMLSYSSITTLVFSFDEEKTENGLEDFSIILHNGLKEHYEKYIKSEDDLNKMKMKYIVLAKSLEHLDLAINQKQSLYLEQVEELKNTNNEIQRTKKAIVYQNRSYNEIDKKIKKLEESTTGIYTQFVAILGIFTSIMFALIGGFNELTTLAMSVKDTPVPKLLIFMSLLMLGITLLVFMSYSAVSKLTGLKLKSCQCSDDEECRCLFREKHPTVFYTSFFLICIMMTGFLLGAFYDKNPKINPTIDLAHINGYIIPLVLLLIFLIIVSVLIYKIVFSKQLELPREISIEEANYHINKLNNRMIALWVVVTILLGLTIIQLIL